MPQRMLALLCGLLLSAVALAQDITVKGTVTDAAGEPITGATIRVEGQQGGAVTDIDGVFTVKAKTGATISVSYIGYADTKVTAQPNLTVVLKENSKSLNEVVVIGYGVAKKSDLTGSVTALKPDGKNKGLVVNPQDMIGGKVAGVSVVTNDGAPGTGAQIRIRGGSSLNASNDPLIVIDGVPMDNNGVKGLSNPLSMINPQDIESFNVLKDASATAIYGSRGSNGVIIITTKKGRTGQKPSISYAGSATVSMKQKSLDVLDGNEYRTLIKSLWGDDSDAVRALGTANTDWQSLIYRTAVSHDHNVTVSGAAGQLPYRVSVGYTGQQGILKTSDFQRVTGALNLNPSLLDNHLTFNLNAKGMYARTVYADGEAIGSAFRFDPTQDPYSYTSPYFKTLLGDNLNGMLKNFGGYYEWAMKAEYKDPAWPFTYNNQATKNPLAILNERHEVAHSRSFIGSADVDYKVHGFEDLRLHLTLGADISKGTQYRDATPASPQFIYYGSHGSATTLKRNLTLSGYAQWYHDFDKDHHFDIMGGYEWQHFWRSEHSDYVGYYQKTNSEHPGEAMPHTPWEYKTDNYLVSFFGRANYTLMNRYFLTATVRDDGSSRFKNHWAMFPSVAFAWKINDENEWRKIKWLSDLKLRLGWGMTGQQDVNSDYAWIPTYNRNTGTDSFYPVYGDGTLIRPNNYTEKLKWETTTTYNVGLDFGIFDQRLTGTVDWYYRQTDDLLNYAPLHAFEGYRNQAWQNIGSLKNTGVEFSLDWKVVQKKGFYWTLNYNFTYNTNKILDLNGVSSDGSPVPNTDIKIGTDKYLQYNQVGHPANSFYVYQQVYDKNGKPLEGVVVDRNGDGKISAADRYFYKSALAPVLMGFASRMEYKGWDLGFSLRASIGNYVFNNIESGQANMNRAELWSANNYHSNRPVSSLAAMWQSYNAIALLSDRYVHNASFLKMDNVTLGYSFENLFKNAAGRGLNGRVYGTVSNVFTLTKYKGLDPEIKNGYDDQLYPRPISFIVGLNLNF